MVELGRLCLGGIEFSAMKEEVCICGEGLEPGLVCRTLKKRGLCF